MHLPIGLFTLIVLFAGVVAQILPEAGSFRIEIVLERLQQDTWHAIDSRLVLDKGDRVRFRVRSSISGYLQVTNRSSSGGYEMLFPGPDTGLQNELEAGREIIVPTNEGWFRIAGPAGQDVLYWLVSPIQLVGLPEQTERLSDAQSASGSTLLPRCDPAIFRARGDCIDNSAGPKALPGVLSLPDDFSGLRNLKSRDLVFIRQGDAAIVSTTTPLNGPVIYEIRLAHR